MTPQRIQLSRRKGWRMPANTVKVSRPSEFGNPYQFRRAELKRSALDLGGVWEWWIEGHEPIVYRAASDAAARQRVVDLFTAWVMAPERRKLRERAQLALRGRNLACWCRLDQPCHADVWLELANRKLHEPDTPQATSEREST